MRACAVVTCKNRGVHTFPTDEFLKRQWIKATRVDVQRKIGWHIRKYSCVCSDHFTPSDFETRGKRRTLKRIAVPSIFPWTAMPSTSSSDIEQQQQEQIQTRYSLSQESFEITFNTNNAFKNYSRSEPSISFVEEYPNLNLEMSGDHIDPLQINNDGDEYAENISENLPLVPDESGEEVIINVDEDQDEPPKHSEIISDQISKCDNSAQTDHIEFNFKTDQSPFSVYKYKHIDKAIHFYTGLETFQKLMYVFYTLGDCSNLKYFYETPPSKLTAFEQFFIALMILRRHKEFEEIAMLYLISVKQVSNIFVTWIRVMALQWKNLWIDRETVTSYMPLDFYDKYPMTRVVLECPIKKPGLPLPQQVTFSSYKNRNTIKFLIGIAPSGLITYISPSYGGSATDRQIIERSSILHRFNYNDEIMVDKGLNVQDIFLPYEVKVNMPSFFKKGNQINPDTLIRDRKIASKRVHVERVIGMLKTFKILQQRMNQMETMLSSDIAFICAMLVNFRSNVVNTYA